MTKLFLLLLLPFALHASKILSYNIYDRTDRVDVMITFDTPFDGKIKQSVTPSKIIIKLEGASIEATKTKVLSSKFLNSINIVPLADYTKIVASIPAAINLQASKTSDSYGLRLRFSNVSQIKKEKEELFPSEEVENPLAALPTKKDDSISSKYYMVIAILIIGIIILLVLKNKMNKTQSNEKPNSWLFKNPNQTPQVDNDEVSIRFQKNINDNNNVVMLDFMDQSYLVLMGPNNVLLDRFTDNKPVTEDDFETILQNRHQELDNFLKEGEMKTQEVETKDPMQIYKEKAANISYTT